MYSRISFVKTKIKIKWGEGGWGQTKSSNKLKICLNIVTRDVNIFNPDVKQVCATKKQEKLPRWYIIESCQYFPKDLKVC